MLREHYTQSFIVDGNYLGKCLRKPVHLGGKYYMEPMAFCIVCPLCARTWAVCNVAERSDTHYHVLTVMCRDHKSNPYHVAGEVTFPERDEIQDELPLGLLEWNMNRYLDAWEAAHDTDN